MREKLDKEGKIRYNNDFVVILSTREKAFYKEKVRK